MGVSLLGNPAPLYDIHLGGSWPIPTAISTVIGGWEAGFLGDAWPVRDDTSPNPREIFSFSREGAGVTSVQAFYNGLFCTARQTSNGSRYDGMRAITLMPVIDSTGLDPAFQNPSWRRVHWMRFNLAMDVGTLDDRTGLMFACQPFSQSVQWWPRIVTDAAAAWYGGYGVVGDGAGNWDWVTYTQQTIPPPAPPWTAPNTETVSLASAISDASDWNTFDFVCISAAGGRDAVFQLWINGSVFLERNWVDAPLMPPLGPLTGIDVYRYSPVTKMGTPTSENIYYGDWEFLGGRFTPDGREIFK